MTILVTGGAGFVGSNLCERLLALGHAVIAVDNFITGSPNNVKSLREHPNFKFFELDITKPEFPSAIADNFPQIDQIYNLACPTGVPNCLTLAEEMIDACSFGTRQVLQLACHYQAPIVVTSTAEVYGDPEIFPQVETYNGNVSTTGPRSAYEEGKRFTEALVAVFVRKYGLKAKIARLFNAYGPRMSSHDLRVNAQLIRQALSHRPLTVWGNGRQTRTFCYVDDTANGLLTIMENGQAGAIYNLGSDEQITIGELAQKIISLTGSQSKIKFVPHPINADHQGRQPNIEKLKSLGWQRSISLEDGLVKMIAFIEQSEKSKTKNAAKSSHYLIKNDFLFIDAPQPSY